MKASACLFVMAFLLAGPTAGAAQIQERDLAVLKEELEALKAGQTSIQKDLQEIRQLLREGTLQPSTEPAPGRYINVAGAPSKGNPEAKVTLIEFSDYQCAFCGRHARDTFADIVATFVSTGKVRYVFRSFPIEAIHPLAFRAHEAAECAGEQKKYWEMHNRLFANQEDLGLGDLPKHAAAIGLDARPFQACLEDRHTAARIRQDIAEARSIGVSGTPTFFVGLTEPNDGKVKVLRTVRGAQGFETLRRMIESVSETK